MDFPQPRPKSFFLRSRCRRVPGRVRGRSASCAVRSGSSMILVAVLDSLDFCHSHSLGDPPYFPSPDHWPCGPPIDETDLHHRAGNHGWPAYFIQSSCSSCVASRVEPNPCETRRTLGHTLASSETCLNMERNCVGQANNPSVNRNGLCEYHHMQQRLPRG